ncbi:MAG: class I SAM-dependent methyltransferase [Acidimicrobiales bacterium]
MGIYREQILPRFIDKALGNEGIAKYRREVTAGLSGEIVEIGFGSGLNMPEYPPEVTRVFAVEPASVGKKLAAERVAASPIEVTYIGLDGRDLPLGDDSCDGALSTFTLCTIPDEAAALAELVRVVRPGGRIHLLEHGRARDDDVHKWQQRLNPIQRRVGDGCHLDRDHTALVEAAGLEIEDAREWYAKGPKPMSAFYLLRTRVPETT